MVIVRVRLSVKVNGSHSFPVYCLHMLIKITVWVKLVRVKVRVKVGVRVKFRDEVSLRGLGSRLESKVKS